MHAMNRWHALLLLTVCSFWVAEGAAQELTPRTYWPAPKGTKFGTDFNQFLVSYQVIL